MDLEAQKALKGEILHVLFLYSEHSLLASAGDTILGYTHLQSDHHSHSSVICKSTKLPIKQAIPIYPYL